MDELLFDYEFTLSDGTGVWFDTESKIWLYNKDGDDHPVKIDPLDLEVILAVYNRVREVSEDYE